MNRLDARGFERGFQVEIEIGRIHPDKNIRALLQQFLFELLADADDFTVVPQHFHITAHRQLVAGPPVRKTALRHLRSANAAGPQVRPTFAKTVEQQTRKQIARGFAGHHGQGGRG